MSQRPSVFTDNTGESWRDTWRLLWHEYGTRTFAARVLALHPELIAMQLAADIADAAATASEGFVVKQTTTRKAITFTETDCPDGPGRDFVCIECGRWGCHANTSTEAMAQINAHLEMEHGW